MPEKILLHSCCGPCSSACIERLSPDHDITVYYYNPCIDDPEEYEKRKETLQQLISAMSSHGEIGFAAGPYEPDKYLELVKGLENEPEGGARCAVCFRMRLMEAARYAKEHGFEKFTTTLTVSPHKNYKVISEIGAEAGNEYGVEYVPYDFKKKDGFLRSIQLSKKFGLYRQDYCGCSFSKR